MKIYSLRAVFIYLFAAMDSVHFGYSAHMLTKPVAATTIIFGQKLAIVSQSASLSSKGPGGWGWGSQWFLQTTLTLHTTTIKRTHAHTYIHRIHTHVFTRTLQIQAACSQSPTAPS